jgi:hypothetical protein
MRNVLRGLALASLLLGLSLGGCGGDREERGLAPDPEVADPESARALEETEAQRDEEMATDLDAAATKEFDETEEDAEEEEQPPNE